MSVGKNPSLPCEDEEFSWTAQAMPGQSSGGAPVVQPPEAPPAPKEVGGFVATGQIVNWPGFRRANF